MRSSRARGAAPRLAGTLVGLVLFLAPALLLAPAAFAEEPRPAEGAAAEASGPLLDPSLPLAGLFAGTSGQVAYIPVRPRLNFDISSGPFIPIEGDEEFHVGGTVDLKFQGQVVRNFFLGGEFAFAGHDKDAGELLSEGTVDRFYLLLPLEVDLPLGGWQENPFSLRLGVAPGLQIADPVVDSDLKDILALNGLRLEEDTMVAFNLRGRVGLRLPIDPHFGFLIEAAYDWAEGRGKARIKDFSGATVDSARRHVNLSGVSILFGFQIIF